MIGMMEGKVQVLEDMMELQFQVLGQIWGYYF